MAVQFVRKESLLPVSRTTPLRTASRSEKNGTRLWSEEPDWWKECTKLPWKNPREHPKDKKDTLKQKIEILEKQLRERGLMTPAIEQELELSKSGKKADLELKSDFEAVIAKASGLHYMVNQVYDKMSKAHVFSDKIAVYVRETKSCLEQCLTSVSKLFQRVESREKRKQSLWDKMGVSQSKRIRPASGDFPLDELGEVATFIQDNLLSLPDTQADVYSLQDLQLSVVDDGDGTVTIEEPFEINGMQVIEVTPVHSRNVLTLVSGQCYLYAASFRVYF
nr:hypothetical protein BaRGS_010941 [Batillaria attramentaria]